MNVKNELISIELHAQGTIDESIAYPREIIRKALFVNAGGLILLHNHPSGHNEPSRQDLQLTAKIKETSKIFDITVLDHVIIGTDEEGKQNYYSLQAKGEI